MTGPHSKAVRAASRWIARIHGPPVASTISTARIAKNAPTFSAPTYGRHARSATHVSKAGVASKPP
jgi:hypothetical protein